MDWIYGVSDCWVLSRSCRVNWNAWAAVGALAAVLVALGLAAWQHMAKRRDEHRRAKAMAEPLFDELRAIHYRLQRLEGLRRVIDIQQAWKLYRAQVSGLITPVFDRFSDDVPSFDGSTAASVLRAYGHVIRTRDLLLRRQPEGQLNRQYAPEFERFLGEIPATIEPIRANVDQAVRLLATYTPHKGRDPFVDEGGDDG